METRFFLLLSKPFGTFFTPLQMICAISGKAHGVYGLSRQFSNANELAAALGEVGIPEPGFRSLLSGFNSGFPAFLEVSLDIAKKLDIVNEISTP